MDKQVGPFKKEESCETAGKDESGDFADQTGSKSAEVQNVGNVESDSVLLTDTLGSQETSESAVDMSETFITIETKDGQSSERIPFSQFLKNVVVDKQSGNFTLNLEQFLGTSTGPVDVIQEAQSCTVHENEFSKNLKNDKPSSSSVKLLPEKNVETIKTLDNGSSKSSLLNGQSTSKANASHRSRKVVKTTIPHPTRRSSRVTAKNKRFTEDFVSSLTLGKSSSSSSSSTSTSSWNTQLMTLALAAETHKNTPQEENVSESHGDVEQKKGISMQKMEVSSDQVNTLIAQQLSGNSANEEKKCQILQANPADSHKKDSNIIASEKTATAPIDGQTISDCFEHENVVQSGPTANSMEIDVVPSECTPSDDVKTSTLDGAEGDISKADETKTGTSSSCEGKPIQSASTCPNDAKSSKKYESALSVIKKTFSQANETARCDLSSSTPEQSAATESDSSPNVYFTIMEPKTDAQGYGLLVNKTEGKTDFAVAEIVEALAEKALKASTSSPQDQFFSSEQVLTSTSSLLRHRQSAHSKSDHSPADQHKTTLPGVYQCGFCEQKFPYKFMLDLHIKRKRHTETKENFSTHKAQEAHRMMAHRARSCRLYGKEVANVVMLRRHIGNDCHAARLRMQAERLKGEATNEVMVLPSYGGEDKLKPAEKSEVPKLLDKDIQSTNEVSEIVISETTESLKQDKTKQTTSLGSVQTRGSHKLHCQICFASFFTSSGLWKHKMEKHHQFYPQGFRERLLERLHKNQTLLANTENALVKKSSSAKKSKFFVIMNPKVTNSKTRLSVNVTEDKEFMFTPRDDKAEEDHPTSDKSDGESPTFKQTVFNCSQCKLSFPSASDYRDHRSKTHGECFEAERLLGVFQCTLCSDSFPCQFMLDKHLKKHVGKKLLPCTLCGLQFHKIQERRQHWKTAHPGIGCPNCGKMYASIKYLQKHISLNCQDHFPPSQKFLEFQKKQHNDFEMDEDYKRVEKKILRCHLCPKICSSVHGWRRHMTEAHEDVGFSKLSNTCIICGQLVYGYKALEKHILEKHAQDSGLPVDEENNLVQQAVKKSDTDIAEYKSVGKNTAEITRDEFGNYQCPSCPKTHPDLRAIKTHMRTHVDMELECSHCGKTFKNPSLLKQHIQRHRKDAIYTCEVCDKSFPTLLKLNKHCKVHHAKGNYVCELCGASFALNEYLQKHRKCHNDIRPHSCSVCAKTFRTKPELRVHFRIHTRETPHICQYCGRGFSQRGNYRTHLAQHTGVKPYQCDRCPLSFALKCHLTRHLATHDQLIQYRCLWCDKECTQRKHMQMHVLRVHQEDFVKHEEAMRLDTPTPIPESQARLYNRRPAKASKIRRQYRTKAEKCEPAVTDHPELPSDSVAQMIVGLPAKSEPVDVTPATEGNIIHVVDAVEEHAMVSCVVPEEVAAVPQQRNSGGSSMGNFEVLVNGGTSEDHQAYTKNDITIDGTVSAADLLLQENMQLVVGDNNEISIIIKNEEDLHNNLVEHQEFEARAAHPSLQDAIIALATQSVEIKEEGTGVSLAIAGLDKQEFGEDNHILSFVPGSGEDL
ncbi:zinc finger protein 26 [Elysia marginata]|uniref:Zinc finger protein 26 n=1 Tax=Elysia marginata TaxID=1093978 RepID=A0AAV4GVR3_9GAST|nr:zinc finger protein 26 [Elysia marginata]